MDISRLKDHLPEDIFRELSNILKTRMVSKPQLCHLLANCAHESQGWTRFVESLKYSAKRLLQVFPKKFRDLQDAQDVVDGGERAIANFIYNGRMGNERGTDDGYNFRGSGCVQLTGRYNFTLFDATVPEDIINNPDLVRTKYKISSAFWFFDYNGIWFHSLDGKDTTIRIVRRMVNGGINGYEEVRKYYRKYEMLL